MMKLKIKINTEKLWDNLPHFYHEMTYETKSHTLNSEKLTAAIANELTKFLQGCLSVELTKENKNDNKTKKILCLFYYLPDQFNGLGIKCGCSDCKPF